MTTAAEPRYDFGRLTRRDVLQLAGAIVLLVSMFLPWYSTDANVPRANIEGESGDVTAWVAHPLLRWVLLAVVAAAIWSAWMTVTGHQPKHGGHRGETSSVVAIIVVGLVLIQGFLARPGDPESAINLAVGWYLALAGSLLALGAAIARQPPPDRKPPGV